MNDLLKHESFDLKKKYEALLLEYIENEERSKLGQAYQLGRDVISKGIGMLEIAEIHHETLSKVLSNDISSEEKKRVINSAMEFFLEYFSSYEMVIRGFKEMIDNLKQRTSDLENANKEFESFSYLATHDLRGALRSITVFAQILQKIYTENFPNEGKDCLDRIVKAGKKMDELIESLISLSHISTKEVIIESVNLGDIAEEIISELNNKSPERKSKIKIEKDLKAFGDKKLLTVLLTNILENAWKYTSKKEISEIQFGSKKINNQKVYFIRDNGSGFNMEYISKLFMPFQRLHAEEKLPGIGVGLAIAMRIIVKHSGKIWAESEIDEGTVFYFSIGTNEEE